MLKNLKKLTPEHNRQLLALSRACPIIADFTFYFDRAPDFFAWPAAVFDEHAYWGIEQGGVLRACVGGGWREGFTGQGQGTFFYLGDARVLPELRGQRLAERIAMEAMNRLPQEIEIGFGIIKKGNLPAERSAATATPERFVPREVSTFEAYNIVPFRRLSRPGVNRVRRARPEDLPDMAALMTRCYEGRLFAPTSTVDTLAADLERLPGLPIEQYYLAERGGRLVGVLGAWDMTQLKRSVILRYTGRGKALRLGYRLVRLLYPRATPLPESGEAFRSLSVTRLAVADRDPEVLRDMLATVVDDILGRGYHLLHVAFVGDDPLKRALRQTFAQRFESSLFVGTPSNARGPDPLVGRIDPYVDLALI